MPAANHAYECLLRVSIAWDLENLEIKKRDAGLHEKDMLLTPYQELLIESGAVDVRASFTTGK